jgi:transposase
VPIHNSDWTVSSAHLFVAVLGASNKTYAEAFPNQQLPSWIAAHCRAYEYFQVVRRLHSVLAQGRVQ